MKRPMDFEEFLKEITPCLGLQWRPFRRRGIQRKIKKHMEQTGLYNFESYMDRIKEDPETQTYFIKILTITISRFFRDYEVYQVLKDSIIPTLLQKKKGELKIWSIGCASGEEPYSIVLLWKETFEKDWEEVKFSVLATDINEEVIERAKEGRYKESSLREVPQKILEVFFKKEDGYYRIDPSIKSYVEFKRHDILRESHFREMDLTFCRNLAFTYFSKSFQIETLKKIAQSLREEGYLIIGKDETLPLNYPARFALLYPYQKIYQKL
ncbi:MAG: CheR family methyltransferase [Thermodesulfobacteriota bacterium]